MRRYKIDNTWRMNAYNKALALDQAVRVWANGKFQCNVHDECAYIVDCVTTEHFEKELMKYNSKGLDVKRFTGDIPDGYSLVWDGNTWNSLLPDWSEYTFEYGEKLEKNGFLKELEDLFIKYGITKAYTDDTFTGSGLDIATIEADTCDEKAASAITMFLMDKANYHGETWFPACDSDNMDPTCTHVIYEKGVFYANKG